MEDFWAPHQNWRRRANDPGEGHNQHSSKGRIGRFYPPPEFAKSIPQAEKYGKYLKWKNAFDVALSIIDGNPSDNQKVGLLFTNAGDEIREVITTLSLPPMHEGRERGENDYKVLSNGLNAFFRSLVDESTEIARYEARKQESGETARQFLMKLRELAGQVAVDHGSPHFRHRFLAGLANRDLAKRAIEEMLDLKTVVERAGRLEQEAEMARTAAVNTPAVALVQGNPRLRPRRPANNKRSFEAMKDAAKKCQRCGRWKHVKEDSCPALGAACRLCNMVGHFAATCRTEPKAKVESGGKPKEEENPVSQVKRKIN